MNRLEVHSHTHYSNIRLLDCINKPKDLINKAKEIGLKGICVTDHECLSSAVELNELQQELIEKGSDFKIGLGNEIYLCDTREPKQKYYHFILIAKNEVGHKQLRKLSSRAWMYSFEDRRMERVVTLKSDLYEIIGSNKGNVIATTACIGGELSTLILEMETARANNNVAESEIAKEKIINFVLEMKEIFGDDFYFEVAPAASKEQIIVNKKMAELSTAFGVKIVIGSDAHYLSPEDRYVHEAFLNSKGGERETAQFYEYAYLQTEEEIIKNLTPSIVDLYEQMCQNSMEIYDKIENYSLLHPQRIPKVDVEDYPKKIWTEEENEKYPTLSSMIISDDKYKRYWVNQCIDKLIDIDKFNDEYMTRLEYEADIKETISEKLGTNMFSYPITLQHYINLIWDCGSTVGAGRGSSCSGLNHYLLGVTQLDPIEWDLPFWRYLNKERIELGDIDIDIAPSKKGLILQKIREERGQKFLPEIDDLSRKNLGCTLIATFGTETSKSAIKTACRGYRSAECPNGIDNDIATYLSSLVPVERGFVWSLNEVVYGDEEKGRKPVTTFINEISQYPGLFEIMVGVEGLISKRSSHASGVIFFDEDPYEFGCFMRTPNGEIITQYDLHKAEAAGMTKYDFLVTSAQDKIIETIKLLQQDKVIDDTLSIREVYDKYLHPSVLDIEDKDTWQKIQNIEVINLFQFDSDVGSQAAKKIKPSSMLELSDANGLMRLMTAEKGAETPMEKYIRFKNNISLWYKEMNEAGLTKEEQEVLKPHFLKSHGVPPSQEQLMTMLMDENICNFSLKDANAARKIVGKKQMNKIPALHQQVLDQAKSPALGEYVWKCGIGPQMGYSFSIIHALAYSFIAYQMAYLATKYNPIYWNCACLIVNSEAIEEIDDDDDDDIVAEEDKKKEKAADYEKIAKALNEMISQGVKISLVNINKSGYTFKPDVQNNRILYGLKPLSRINEEIYNKIIAGRPYLGIKDFMARCPLPGLSMVALIKAGAFDEVEETLPDRRSIMAYYLKVKSEPKTRLNLQNFSTLSKLGLFPKEMELTVRLFNFNKYIKGHKYQNYFALDDYCYDFLYKNYPDALDYVVPDETYNYLLDSKGWDKIYQKGMDVARDYIKEHQEELLTKLNDILFLEKWNKYATGTLSKWEMDSLCFYYHTHELSNVNVIKYGIKNFFDLPKEPEVEYMYLGRVPIYKLSTVIGTVIAKNDTKSSITLLSCQGVFTVKFTRDYYSMFKKQISVVDPETGKKKVMEKGWFAKGTKLMITGFRRDDMFIGKTYAKTVGHQLYKINDIYGDGITLQHDRYTAADMFEEDDIEDIA